MKKKTYEVPAMQVIEFKSQQPLLTGSSNIDGYENKGRVDSWSNWEEEE